MKCFNCKSEAVGCWKSASIFGYSKDNFAFDLYFCEIHLKKVLKENDIEIDEFDDNKN
ncbi:hypothetical protein [Spiroplasma endosymbiont of Amphimallon solstitiale]|uniref:hypothetical protein n=1 Tax=Spiroplasma endosymbiont of Amphimallon solstitiale TaxID=3066288 RepID=UPI00313BE7FE